MKFRFKNKILNEYLSSLALSAMILLIGYVAVYGADAGGSYPQSLDTVLLIGNTTTKTATFGNVYTSSNIVATGTIESKSTITGTYFYGNGSHLTGISSASPLELVCDQGCSTTATQTLSVLGTLTTGTNALSGSQDVTFWGSNGAATPTKFLWNASKAAIRAGWEQSGEWADGSTGLESTAFGAAVMASGLYSVALGGACTASGADGPACIGYNSTASGKGSIALGTSHVASGNYSTSLGYDGTAAGVGSVVLGSGNAEANGDYSFAIGGITKAQADGAMTIGRGTTAFNYLTNSDNYSLCVGFLSDVCTLKVGSGTDSSGSYGQTDINGPLVAGDTITATGTIRTNTGFNVNGSAGIDFTQTICCTYDGSFACTATGTVTFSKGILTAETCP